MKERTGEFIYTASCVLAGLIGLFVPVAVVLWLLGHWSDKETSASVILACFLASIVWVVGRLTLNGVRSSDAN